MSSGLASWESSPAKATCKCNLSLLLSVSFAVTVTMAMYANAATEFVASPTWTQPSSTDVQTQLFEWIDLQTVDIASKDRAKASWIGAENKAADRLLDQLVQAIAVIHEPTRKLVESCQSARTSPAVDVTWLGNDGLASLIRNNVRLYYARWLAQQRLYDESMHILSDIGPDDVVDPASLLFYVSVGHHVSLNQEAGLTSIGRLLERSSEIPARYRSVATLMLEDLKRLEEDSLDHISRRMGDVTRRLELGRAGQKTIEVEEGVIASLDKLIKKMEEQQQQQQSSSSSSQFTPGTPAQESMPFGGKGPGEVVKRDIGSKSGWGDLPPKQREEALQSMSKEFPSHYRDVIESYFRRLAGENNDR